MHLSFAILALAAHFATMLRVLVYRRNGARHRRHVSWAAWALLAVSGGSSIELALHAQHVGIFEALTAVLLAMFVCAARGNVARLLWSDPQ